MRVLREVSVSGTAYDVGVNNRYGTIVDVGAAGTLTPTDPWTNFTY